MKEFKSVKQIDFDEVEESLNNGIVVLAMNGIYSFWTVSEPKCGRVTLTNVESGKRIYLYDTDQSITHFIFLRCEE